MEPAVIRSQLNVRVSKQAETLIDQKRIELSKTLGTIPSRSDVVRLALEAYLGVNLGEWEVDGRKTKSRATADGSA
jgi:hypothetical protein